MRGRWVTLPLLVCAVQFIAAPGAHASLWLELEPARGAPGETVDAHTLGREPFPPSESPRSFDLHLQSDEERIAFGVLEVAPDGNGSGNLTVPEVEAGNYTVFIDCPPCASHSAGRSILPVGELEVLTGPQSAGGASPEQGGARLDARLAFLAVPILLGAWIVRRRRLLARLSGG